MKRPSIRDRRFREFIDHSLTPFNKAPQDYVDAACDRVLQRLRGEPEDAVNSIAADLHCSSPGRQWFRPFLVCAAAVIVVVAVLQVSGIRKFVFGGEAPAVAETGRLEAGQTVRTNSDSGALFTLADGTRVEMRANSELSLEPADDGLRIHLMKGVVIVTAAKQRGGHLYVQTKDVSVSVVGTVFRVEVEEEGSRVAVIEGEVRVKYGEIEKILRKGEQVATNPNREGIQLTALQPPATTPPQRSTTAPARSNIAGDYWQVLPPSPLPLRSQPASNVPPGEVPKWEAVSIRPCRLPTGGGGGRGGGGGGGVVGGVLFGGVRFDPDRMFLNCLTLRTLIRSAYHVYSDLAGPGSSSPFLLPGGMDRDPLDGTEGGPDWLDTDLYRIEAKAEVVTDRNLMQGPMLQAILEERFKIKVHKEAREMPVDALVLARGGSKLKPFVEGSCVRPPPGVRPEPESLKLHIEADATGKLSGTMENEGDIRPLAGRVEGQSLSFTLPGWFGGRQLKGSIEDNGARLVLVVPPPPEVVRDSEGREIVPRTFVFTRARPTTQRYCRVVGGRLDPNRGANRLSDVEGVTLDEFAQVFLKERRGRYVINKTGLTGKFDIHLEEEISVETRQELDPNGDRFAPSTAPPFPEALEKQLGLKLESTKGPVELLIIDYIERPSEN